MCEKRRGEEKMREPPGHLSYLFPNREGGGKGEERKKEKYRKKRVIS